MLSFWLSKLPEKALSGGVSLFYFTQTLILQSKCNTLCLLSLWEWTSWGKQRHFLNFSRHQEINLYRKETAQYVLIGRGKRQITWHEKHQEPVQWPVCKPQMRLELDMTKQKATWDACGSRWHEHCRPRIWVYCAQRSQQGHNSGAPHTDGSQLKVFQNLTTHLILVPQ